MISFANFLFRKKYEWRLAPRIAQPNKISKRFLCVCRYILLMEDMDNLNETNPLKNGELSWVKDASEL